MKKYEYDVIGHDPVNECVFVVLPTRFRVWLWLIRNLRRYGYVSVTKSLKIGTSD